MSPRARPKAVVEEPLAVQLGKGLLAARAHAGTDGYPVSRKALAEAHGLAPNTLGELEHGKANPTLARVEEVARLYGADVTITITPRGPTA